MRQIWNKGIDVVDALIMIILQQQLQDLSKYDRRFLEKIVNSRSEATRCKTNEGYLTLIAESPAEQDIFLASLNISYTEFFRNSLAFANLRQWIIPGLIRAKSRHDEIRVWSAGCSTGQEAYSIAMLLDQCLKLNHSDLIVRIFASDLVSEHVSLAERGIYKLSDLGNVPMNYYQKYFVEKESKYEISPVLRQGICFTVYDLLDTTSYIPAESIYGDFDLIFCCNLLFYYQKDQQQQIIDKLFHALSGKGYLVTGETERYLMSAYTGLRSVAAPATIYQVK